MRKVTAAVLVALLCCSVAGCSSPESVARKDAMEMKRATNQTEIDRAIKRSEKHASRYVTNTDKYQRYIDTYRQSYGE